MLIYALKIHLSASIFDRPQRAKRREKDKIHKPGLNIWVIKYLGQNWLMSFTFSIK
jgi:hypothetical protein